MALFCETVLGTTKCFVNSATKPSIRDACSPIVFVKKVFSRRKLGELNAYRSFCHCRTCFGPNHTHSPYPSLYGGPRDRAVTRALFPNHSIISPLCLVRVRAPLWPHVRQAKFCLQVCQVVFLGVLPFSPHLLIGPSLMS